MTIVGPYALEETNVRKEKKRRNILEPEEMKQ